MVFIEIIIGVALAAGCILGFRQYPHDVSKDFFSKTLILAALIYVLFAVVGLFLGSASIGWLGVEILGLVLFSIFAFYGKRGSVSILAAGWLFHTVWDVGLHSSINLSFVPTFYPMVCLGFDLVFGGLLLYNFSVSFRD